ncbi:MAG: leukotoxin LktA family filamentous adhesin [Pseudomonadota bacterium]
MKNNEFGRRTRRGYNWRALWLRRAVGVPSAAAIALLQVAPAYAQIVTDGSTATTVNSSGAAGSARTIDITTGTLRGTTAFNSFSQFDVLTNDTVNMVQPSASNALVNIVNGGQSTIAGQVNLLKNGTTAGSNVFFVNKNGFIVSASGVINAGQLTLSTPTQSVVDGLLAEADGSDTGTTNTAALFAGTEDLDASGSIEIYGVINAQRLELRAGARMLVDGRIVVEDTSGTGTVDPAVSTDGIEEASGVSVEGGVIRLFAGGDIDVGANADVSAKRGGGAGGSVQGASGANFTVAGGAEIDVSGTGSGAGGSVVFFGKNSAAFAETMRIDASATAGAGGFAALVSDGDLTVAGEIATGSTGSRAGALFVDAKTVTIDGALLTSGGDFGVTGDNRITVTGSVNTRHVAAGGDAEADASISESGDLILSAPDIDVEAGASLRADADNGNQGGLVALLARDRTEGVLWTFEGDDRQATIDIDQATLDGGAVLISAYAQSTNIFGDTEDSLNEYAANFESDQSYFEAYLDTVVDKIDTVLDRGLDAVNDLLIPLQVYSLTADAKITIDQSTINGDGNWKNLDISPTASFSGDLADNGRIGFDGLPLNEYELIADNPLELNNILLPAGWDPTNDAVFIQSHAATEVEIAPITMVLAVAVAVTDTDSQVKITDSNISSGAGDVSLFSTANENINVAIAPYVVAGLAGGVVFSTRDLKNQLLVDGGSINSGGAIDTGAYSGYQTNISNIADAYQDGWYAIAVTISISDGLTEAAVGGDLDAVGDITVDAESVLWEKTHVTNTLMGLNDPLRVALWNTTIGTKLAKVMEKATPKFLSSSTDEDKKPGSAGGFTLDLQWETLDTYASLGGDFRDLSNGEAVTALKSTDVRTLGAVGINSAYRFATVPEGGLGLTRNVQSAMGSLDFLTKKYAAALGVSQDELTSSFGKARFVNLSLSNLAGDTVAELGADTVVNAGSLDVDALTSYPSITPAEGIKDGWDSFGSQVAEFELPSVDPGSETTGDIEAPDLFTYIDPFFYVTSETKSKAIAPVAKGVESEQKQAIAISVNVFNTDNETTAAIRDGADVTLTGDLNVTALQEALNVHVANLPKKNPISSAKTEDSTGGAVILARSASLTEALIGDGAQISADDITVEADTDIVQINFSFAAASAKGSSINAAVAANVIESTTRARVSDTAILSGDQILIEAEDRSILWAIGGAVSKAQNEGFGGSGAVNFISRDVEAGIGSGNGALQGTAGTTRITAADLTVNARNNALDVAAAVAGSKVHGKIDDPDGDNDEPIMTPNALLSDDEQSAIAAQNNFQTPEDDAGTKKKTGWSASGSAAMNLVLENEMSAEVASNARIDLSGNLDITATNVSTSVTVAGSAATAKNADPSEKTNSLAGAIGVTYGGRDVTASLRGATVEAANVTVEADDQAMVVGVAAGGAKSSNADKTLAGSVTVIWLDGDTEAEIDAADVTVTGTARVEADDTSTTAGAAGAVSVNGSKTEGYGIGLAAAMNTVDRDTKASVEGGTTIDAASVIVRAQTTAEVYGIAATYGVGKTGAAGSVAVNTWTGGAIALIDGDADGRIEIDADTVTVAAEEDAEIWSLAGAISRGQSNAVGGAVAVNTIIGRTKAVAEYTDLVARTSTLTLDIDADATSYIGSLAAAGGAATTELGIGVGISANTITGGVTAGLTDSDVTDGGGVTLTADSDRDIRSLGGGVTAAGKTAAGFASTLNLILANDTLVDLDGTTIDATGALTARAENDGSIGSIAAAVSLSKNTAIGGAVTVNVATGSTKITAENADITAGGVTLNADDGTQIEALAGAASGSSRNAAGAAITANFIRHDTAIELTGTDIDTTATALAGLTAQATNTGTINTLAAGVGASGNTAITGSIAVGDIGNSARVAVAGGSYAGGDVELSATKTTDIDILAGAAAIGTGGSAFGAGVTVALIHGATTADLTTGSSFAGGDLSVTATNNQSIDAIAAAGAASGSTSIAGSLVYTQIGTAPTGGPSVDPMNGASASDPDPAQQAQDDSEGARDDAFTNVSNISGQSLAATLDAGDVTRARVELGAAAPVITGLEVKATEDATTRSLAGVLSGGTSAGFGAGFAVNLLFGETEAEVILPSGADLTFDAPVAITAEQSGTIETMTAAGAVAGGSTGAGSVVVNVMNREAFARLVTSSGSAAINTTGNALTVRADQSGTIKSLAGTVSGGGKAGFGGAVAVNVHSDDATAEIDGVSVVARQDAGSDGAVTVEALSDMEVDNFAAAAALGGKGAFGGSFAITVADGETSARAANGTIEAGNVTVNADADMDLQAIAGSVAAGGAAAAGLGVVTNISRLDVDTDVDAMQIYATGNARIAANAGTVLSGLAVSGALSGSVSVTGSAVANTSENTVDATISGGGFVIAGGTALLEAIAETEIGLKGGSDEDPGMSLSFSKAGAVGVGASVAVNLSANEAEAKVTDGGALIGSGHGTLTDASGRTHRGTAVIAEAATDIDMVTATGSVGGSVGATSVFSFNTADDSAIVQIGEGTDLTGGSVGGAISLEDLALLEQSGANGGQNATLLSDTETSITTVTASVGVGGTAGVGAAAATNLVTSSAETRVQAGSVGAANATDVTANNSTDITTVVAGLGGGYVGVSASAGVSILEGSSLVLVEGAQIRAGDIDVGATGANDVTIAATNEMDIETYVGGAAGGAVGAAGAVGVTVAGGSAKVEIDTATGADNATSRVEALDDVSIAATTDIDGDSFAASGAGGLFGLALSGNVTLVESTTAVDIGAGQAIEAGNDLSITADELVVLNGIAGGVGAGVVGVGASLDYARFNGATRVVIGAQTDLTATRNVNIRAKAKRTIDSKVAVGSAGALAAAAAISVVEMGGETSDSDRDSLTADVQTELASDQSGGSDTGSGGELVDYSGGSDGQSRAVSARQGVTVDATSLSDGASLAFGDGATVQAGGNVELYADGDVGVSQFAGALSVSGIGVSSGTAVSNVANGAAISFGNNVSILSDANIDVAARTGNSAGDTIDAQAATIAGSAFAGAGVGVVVAKSDSTAAIDAGSGLVLAGQGNSAGAITVTAEREDVVRADVFNFTLSGLYGAGAAVATADNTGTVRIALAGGSSARVAGDSFTLGANDSSAVVATGIGSTLGALGGLNGVVVTADADVTSTVSIGATNIDASTIAISNEATTRSDADAAGVAAGAFAVGASVAYAETDADLSTTLTNVDAEGADISVKTELSDADGTNAKARARSASGGLVAGNGAEADARLDYTITTDVSGDFDATDAIAINATADEASAEADASGVSGGVAAVGVVNARAGQSSGQTATVTTRVRSGTFFSDNVLQIGASNAPDFTAETVSGSGGVVSGSSSRADIDVRTETLTDIGQGGATTLSAFDLSVGATHQAALAGSLNNLSASAVGYSGARTTTDVDSDVETRLRGNVGILAENIQVTAANGVSRPEDGFNITSGSGGLFDVAAISSEINIDAETDLTINSGADILQTGDPDAPGEVLFAVTTDMDITDRLKLDAGGAIAVPIGNSTVKVNTNDATLTIGDADIRTVGDAVFVAGGDAYLKAESDAKSYGLAGAATANTEATYNADHRIVVNSGAFIEALGDVEFKAGHTTTGLQDVTVLAESRVFNKTAIPIPTDPKADAKADTASRIIIGSGAEVLAVEDIYLFAEAGGRNISGYGRGKDLYREVAAAIINGIGGLFGADEVSLDIESGSSTDNSNAGVTVNGDVRAGSRNQQILELAEDYTVLNSADENYDGITWSVAKDQILAQTLQDRIDELNGWINDPNLSQDSNAVIAWQAERSLLQTRMAGAGSTTVDIVTVNPVRAIEGNIEMRGDYVDGSGALTAPGDAQIRIQSFGEALLKIEGAYISPDEGGQILLNDVRVRSVADVNSQSSGGSGASFAFTDGESSAEPVISIEAYGQRGGVSQAGKGSINIVGDVANPRGSVAITTFKGDLDISADISGKSLFLTATEGSLVLGYIPGIREVGSTPEDQYRDYFNSAQDRYRSFLMSGTAIADQVNNGGKGFLLPTFTVRRSPGGLSAGRNIFISADTVNINGKIAAGRSQYDVNIGAGVTADIAALAGSTGRRVIYDPAGATPGNYQSTNITGDVRVSYNFDEGQLELDPVTVEGGSVEIFGDIISTGYGEIEALDGFGKINITSATTVPLVVNRLDLGAGVAGVEGLVRITDTSKTGGDGNALVTEFRRVGNAVQVVDSTTSSTTTDPDTGLTVTVPTNVVSSTVGRDGTYNPTANRDYITLSAEETVREWYKLRKVEVIIGIKGTRRRTSTSNTNISTSTLDLGLAPYVGASIGNYDYHVSGRRIGNTTETTIAERKTYDSVKWYKFGSGWQHFRTDYATTTTHLYTHRLKASYPIAISFAGADQGGLTVNATGNVIFADTVAAGIGTTSISSSQGSIFTAGKQVQLATADLTLSAAQGSITGIDGAFRIDQSVGAVLNATARDAINIREMQGDMNAGTISATGRSTSAGAASTGNVTLYAQGTINQASGGGISGMNIDVTAEEGGLGSATTAFAIDTDGGTLTARARGDVYIRETSGDLGLETVTSDFGSVTLYSAGRILDRNDVETEDFRKQSELEDLWFNDLGLVDTSAREAEQIAALEAERTHAYRIYWQDRDADGGAAQTFTLDSATETGLRNAGWTDDMVNRYVAERQALYDTWNLEVAFDAAYSYTANGAERAEVLDGIGWTARELTRSIREGLVRETGDTVVRVEDPNVVAAGNITLYADQGIGELLSNYTIAAGSSLTDADLAVLAAAEKDDITVLADESLEIRQLEDLDFAFTNIVDGVSQGTLTMVTNSNEIFSGAETAASIANISGPGDVQLRIDGEMRDARSGIAAITGQAIVLESGDFSSIGEEADPLTVNVLAGGSLTARAGVDAWIRATGALPISQIFAGGTAGIAASGAITDDVASGLPRVVADDIILSGATIGTAVNPLLVTQNDAAGSLQATTTSGDLYLATSGGATLTGLSSAASGGFEVAGDLAFDGTNVMGFATGSTFDLTLNGALDLSAANGTDVTGGTLNIRSVGSIGSNLSPFVTALSGLSFANIGSAATPLVVTNTGDLDLTLTQTGNDASDSYVSTTGTLTATNVNSIADVELQANIMDAGTIVADDVTLTANAGIGTASAVSVAASSLTATTGAGGINLALGSNIDIRGLTATSGAITVAGAGRTATLSGNVSTAGDVGFNLASLLGSGDIASGGGNVTLGISGLLDVDGTDVTSSGGNVAVTAGTMLWDNGSVNSAGGTLGLSTSGAMTLTGTDLASAGGDMTIGADGNFAATGSDFTAGAGTFGLTVGGNATYATGAISTDGTALNVDVTGNGDFTGAIITSAGGNVDIDVDGNAELANGSVNSGGGTLGISATGVLELTNNDLRSGGGDMTIASGTNFIALNSDLIAGAGVFDLTVGGNATYGSGTISTTGTALEMNVTGSGEFNSATLASAGGVVDLEFGGNAEFDNGSINSGGNTLGLSATGTLDLVNNDVRSGGGAMTIGSGGTFYALNSDLIAGAGVFDLMVGGNATYDSGTISTTGTTLDIDVTGNSAFTSATIASAGGNITMSSGGNATLTSVGVSSAGGAIDLTVGGNATMNAASEIDAGTGTLTADITGNAQLARLTTNNATDTALSVTVGGTLRAANSSLTMFTANADGALTTLRLGASAETGALGVKTAINRLDAEIASGDVHFNEADGITVERLIAAGSIDLFANGRTELRTVSAGGTATLSATGDLVADGATIDGNMINLFSFGGAIAGATGDRFNADTEAGANVRLFADGDITYGETAGDLILDFALSETGNLDLTGAASVTAGLLGTPGTLTLISNGNLSVERIGGTAVDLADEVGLELVEPGRYGVRVAQSPSQVTLTALPDGASLYLGYGSIRDRVVLGGDDIDAKLYDITPDDDIELTVTDGAGDFADLVNIDFVGDGDPIFTSDPFASARPELVDRDFTTGFVTLSNSKIGEGEITHTGPGLIGENVEIGGDVWFRQRTFDFLAINTFAGLDTDADAEAYATDPLEFIILDEFALQLEGALVLNRKRGGVSLNGGQGFGLAVGVETGILTSDFFIQGGEAGVTEDVEGEEEEWLIDVEELEDGDKEIVLPLITASAE